MNLLPPFQFLFIEPNVPDAEQLLRQWSDDVEVIQLQADRNAITQAQNNSQLVFIDATFPQA